MTFPLRKLRSVGGSLYGHVFENRLTGLPRGLYWSLALQFAAIKHQGESWETSVAAEWLVWPVGRWHDLDGADLARLAKPELAEASFYLAEHQAGRLERLSLSRSGEKAFKVELSLTFDLVEPNGRIVRSSRLDAAGTIAFDGIYVIPENLAPKPRTPGAAAKVASEFIDIGDFEEPTWEQFKYVFPPKGADGGRKRRR
jgi:hypothetical protein